MSGPNIESLDHQLRAGCRIECDQSRIRVGLLEIRGLPLGDQRQNAEVPAVSATR